MECFNLFGCATGFSADECGNSVEKCFEVEEVMLVTYDFPWSLESHVSLLSVRGEHNRMCHKRQPCAHGQTLARKLKKRVHIVFCLCERVINLLVDVAVVRAGIPLTIAQYDFRAAFHLENEPAQVWIEDKKVNLAVVGVSFLARILELYGMENCPIIRQL